MESDWRDQKTTLPATLYTDRARIEGKVYTVRGARLLDVLNGREQLFMALADVTLTNLQTGEVVSRPFLVVSKQAVVYGWPHEDGQQELERFADRLLAE